MKTKIIRVSVLALAVIGAAVVVNKVRHTEVTVSAKIND